MDHASPGGAAANCTTLPYASLPRSAVGIENTFSLNSNLWGKRAIPILVACKKLVTKPAVCDS